MAERYLRCYFCNAEASGVCSECFRGACREHAAVSKSHRVASGISIRLICAECRGASKGEMIAQEPEGQRSS